MSEQKTGKNANFMGLQPDKCSMNVDVNNESFLMSIINFNKNLA